MTDMYDHRKSVQKGLVRQERHSAVGVRGDPKKGGAGGHFVWGSVMTATEPASAILDRNDPNYDLDLGEEQIAQGIVPPLPASPPEKKVQLD